MSLAKVSRQLKREFKANPTKAAVLGVLLLVAVVFWGPLVFKSDDKPKQAKAVAGTVEVVGAPLGAAGTATPKPTPIADWRALARGLAADPRMQTHHALDDDLAPFRAKTAEEENAEWFALLDELTAIDEPEAPKVEAPKPLKFDEYPLVLSSTIVGKRVRTAVINGKARNVGGEIDRINGGAVVLAEVEPQRVVVEWNGKRRALKLPLPGERPTSSDAPSGAARPMAKENTTDLEEMKRSADGDDSEAPAFETESAER